MTPDSAGDLHPMLLKAQRDALMSQFADLKIELDEYEELRSGKHAIIEVNSLAELPRSLVKARISSGINQRELADRLGLKEQQIQRYEASDYAGASLARLLEVARVLGLNFHKSVFLPATIAESEFNQRLEAMGFDHNFVERRLVPRTVRAEGHPGEFVFQATSALSRILGLTPAFLLGAKQPVVDPAAYLSARFKVSASANRSKLLAYTVYAHFLALLLLDATEHVEPRSLPSDPLAFRREVIAQYGTVTFGNVLRFAWEHGVPILPLKDSGAFHAACWRVAGRNVIVLKQTTNLLSRWLFDLLHELHHAAERPDQADFEVIEMPAGDVAQSGGAPLRAEEAANKFAGDVMLGGRAEELAHRAVEMTEKARNEDGRLEYLKEAVIRLSAQEKVDVGDLANYLAHRLALQGENWWGAAMNLQDASDNPWEIARNALVERAQLGRLESFDRQLLLQGLNE
jgi:transcriptional regulator with XRE-family HTH domain